MRRGPNSVRRGSLSEIQPSRSSGRLESRRPGKRRRPTQRDRLRRQLGLEQLEDRRVMSVFYDLKEISDLTAAGGEWITAIDTNVSVNNRGQVAFIADLNSSGEAVMVGDGNSLPANLSSLLGPLDDDYSSPQIAADGKVVVHSDTLGVGAVSEFDASVPVSFTELVTAEGFPANPGTLTEVTLGLRSDDGSVAFVGKSDVQATRGCILPTVGCCSPTRRPCCTTG